MKRAICYTLIALITLFVSLSYVNSRRVMCIECKCNFYDLAAGVKSIYSCNPTVSRQAITPSALVPDSTKLESCAIVFITPAMAWLLPSSRKVYGPNMELKIVNWYGVATIKAKDVQIGDIIINY